MVAVTPTIDLAVHTRVAELPAAQQLLVPVGSHNTARHHMPALLENFGGSVGVELVCSAQGSVGECLLPAEAQHKLLHAIADALEEKVDRLSA